jgi:hypothetical protein
MAQAQAWGSIRPTPRPIAGSRLGRPSRSAGQVGVFQAQQKHPVRADAPSQRPIDYHNATKEPYSLDRLTPPAPISAVNVPVPGKPAPVREERGQRADRVPQRQGGQLARRCVLEVEPVAEGGRREQGQGEAGHGAHGWPGYAGREGRERARR